MLKIPAFGNTRPVGCNVKMTLHKFIARLNWRHVAIHFIATWFFMYSFQTLAVLHDINLVDIFRQSGKDSLMNAMKENKISGSDLTYFTVWTSLANTIGLLVAFGISLTISIKRKWFWFNSFLVLVVVLILGRFDLLGWKYLKEIFLKPGEIFSTTTLEFLVNGLIILTLGLLTFFLAKTNKFIAKGNRATV